eukprot:scaffold59770_cov21-Tisochrysis_lutea.AAC.2
MPLRNYPIADYGGVCCPLLPQCRDDAVLELATVCADLDAMQATLADSAVYVSAYCADILLYALGESHLLILLCSACTAVFCCARQVGAYCSAQAGTQNRPTMQALLVGILKHHMCT